MKFILLLLFFFNSVQVFLHLLAIILPCNTTSGPVLSRGKKMNSLCNKLSFGKFL